MTTQQIWSTVIFLLYLIPIGYLGWRGFRKTGSAEEFLVSNWNIPFWLLTGTLAASLGTAAYFLAALGMGFENTAWEGMSTTLGLGICLILGGLTYAAPLRRLRGWTMADYYGLRFASKGLGTYCGVVMAIGTSVFMVGGMAVAGGYLISAIFGIDFVYGVLIYAAIIGAYCAVGGLWGVAFLDSLQIILAAVGFLAVTLMILFRANSMAPGALFSAEHWGIAPMFTWKGSLFWFLFLSIAIGDIPANDLGQRACAGRTPRTTKRAFIWAGVFLSVLGLIPAIASDGLKIIFAGYEGNPEMLWTEFIIQFSHPLLAGVLLVLFLSAGMSTINSSYVAATAQWIKNIGMDALGVKYDEKRMMRAARIIVSVIAAVSAIMAIFFARALPLVYAVFEIIFVSLTWPVVIGPFWKRLSAKANWVAITAGLAVYLVLIFGFTDIRNFGGVLPGVAAASEGLPGLGGMIVGLFAFPVFWGAVISLVCTVVFGLIFKPTREEELAFWMQRTDVNDDVAGYPDYETGSYKWQAAHMTDKLRDEYMKEGADLKALAERYFEGLPVKKG